MSARLKLNQAYFNGAVAVAILIGCCFNSLWAFLLSAGVLLLSAYLVGDIRSTGQSPRRSSPSGRRRRW